MVITKVWLDNKLNFQITPKKMSVNNKIRLNIRNGLKKGFLISNSQRPQAYTVVCPSGQLVYFLLSFLIFSALLRIE